MYGAGSDPTKPTATGFPVSYSTSTTYTTNDSSSYAPPAPPQPKPIVEWSTGLCDCFSDCGNCNFHNLHSLLLFTTYIIDLLQLDWLLCEIYGKLFVSGCLTWWCPCITFGRIAEIVDRGSSCKKLFMFRLHLTPIKFNTIYVPVSDCLICDLL